MSRLLRDNDYARVIQADSLSQIIESNQQTKLDVEQSAQSEMIGYLTQRYITSQIFTDTKVFDITATYKAKQLIEWTAPTFSATTVYIADVFVVYNGYIYESIAGSTAHAFLATEWTLICEDKALFYAKVPYPEYSNTTTYSVGNIIYYNDKIYICLISSLGILPTNTQFWQFTGDYTFNGYYPNDSAEGYRWTKGDNRNQQIVMYLLDITLYHLHSRINPRNVPDLRKERYDGNSPTQSGGAIAFLKRVASGDVTADLPQILPQQGMSIRYGSAVAKQTNSY
jgi:hypothetical protein